MNLLIGSRALAYWQPNFNCKPNADWDVISPEPIPGTEWHDPNHLNNSVFEHFVNDSDTMKFNGYTLHVVNMTGLAIIKRSHLWRNYKFQSHITQYHKHQLVNYFTLIAYSKCRHKRYYQIYLDRLELTKQQYGNPHPSLRKSSTEFFDDPVNRKYNHDYLHELVAYYDKPLYTRLTPDPNSVWCSADLWDKLSYQGKCKCVSEEVIVTALERFVIPNLNYSTKHAYLRALDKVCTTMCSGWFRDFAIDNYPQIIELYNDTVFQATLTKLGEIK